ncbi:insulinase family protein [Carboxylicivirga sediminis]|uniref:Insulinase family protein n=1 Tax=Carboxylicivirga sediminis TaxID=2006564 RepID=A0A941IXT8_9BACT|nr:M16 family metallopeptidase [Carboxylicivirga sediminis]MBR8535799.1 insulinase family protein [Carboxylicivirga sediminis]
MQKLFTLLLGVFLISSGGYAQKFTDLSQAAPFDTTIKRGVLPNGLSYYLKRNPNPKGMASFYIYQNVGAVLETDKQDGLAHFLEHMAFNGTTTFPGKSMLDMLERNGVKFGKDVNAYTTKNETVYNISRVPSKRKELVDSCLIILRDWCDELSLDEAEIDAERGVISEEWRTRRTAGFRTQNKIAPTIFNGSIYAYRDVIGELDVIKKFDPEELRTFYHEWYRTDLQAIAIVGDVDVEAVEQRVIELFSAIPAIENPKERKDVVIPDNKEPMYVQVSDKEYKNVNINLKIRHADVADNTLQGLRDSYVISFFNTLMKGRYKEQLLSGKAPYINASASYGVFERGYKAFNLYVTANVGKESEAFEAAYTELQRVIQQGFTEAELERLKTNTLVSIKNGYNKRKSINSDSYCKAIKRAYLEDAIITDAKFKYEFANEIIPGITKEEVSAVAAKYLSDLNRSYVITTPDKQGVDFISQKQLEAIIAKVEKSVIAPYEDGSNLDVDLMSTTPVAGEIVNEQNIEEFNAEEWTLSNGAKVIFKQVNNNTNSVILNAKSKGGDSMYEVADLPSFKAASGFISGFGIGNHDPIQLKKISAGKTAGCSYKMGTYNESVTAKAMIQDLETMFQLVYMRFEEPRFDRMAFDKLMERNYYNVENETRTAKTIMRDTLATITANGNPRVLKFDKTFLDQIDYERMQEIYFERLSNAADFTFFIVGDVDAEIIKPLVEEYIGSINTTGNTENWIDHGDFFPKGKHEHRIYLPMEEPKATVNLTMRANADYSRETTIYHNILGSILNLRYTENIREKEGGTYGVSVRPTGSRIPEMKLGLEIKFDCDPAKADYLKKLVYKELKTVQKTVLQSDLDKVVLNMKKNSFKALKNNNYWMSVIQTYYESGENRMSPEYFENVINNVTTKDISKAAKKFLKNADVLDIMFLPEH